MSLARVKGALLPRANPIKNFIMGVIIGFVACFIYEHFKLWGYGETTDSGLYYQAIIFGSMGMLSVIYGLVKKKYNMIWFGIGFFLGTEIKSRFVEPTGG